MKSSQLWLAAALIAITFCRAAFAGQSTAPDGWKKVDVGTAFTLLLPEDMEKTDAVGVEDFVLVYTDGRMRLEIVHRPWGVLTQRKGHRRSRGMRGYREKEMRIDGRRAYVQTFYTNQREGGRAYFAVLTVITRDWSRGVALRATLTGSDASDLRIAERIFASLHFPTERDAPDNGTHLSSTLAVDTPPLP